MILKKNNNNKLIDFLLQIPKQKSKMEKAIGQAKTKEKGPKKLLADSFNNQRPLPKKI